MASKASRIRAARAQIKSASMSVIGQLTIRYKRDVAEVRRGARESALLADRAIAEDVERQSRARAEEKSAKKQRVAHGGRAASGKRVAAEVRRQDLLVDASPESFAERVRAHAARGDVAKWHGDRVFISVLWSTLPEEEKAAMSLADMKTRLVAAHQSRRVRLTRADLVRAMSDVLVRDSLTRIGDAEFHFLALD